MIDPSLVIIEPLEKSHSRGAFSCTVPRINNFFRNNARKDHEAYKVRVFVARMPDDQEILGFFSLTLTALVPEEVSEAAVEKFNRVNAVPAIYLSMIAVDWKIEGQGLGFRLMVDVFDKAVAIAEMAGVYAVALDALDEKVAAKYARYGFEPFKEGELKMFIPLPRMVAALDAAAESVDTA